MVLPHWIGIGWKTYDPREGRMLCSFPSTRQEHQSDLRGTVVKIFLSYGHDQNTQIVLRIKHDLEAAGHVVWIDSSEIKAGDDWRRSIIDGLSDSDWTLGFLSRHSVRNPGVCLDDCT
jgi:TIR domain